MVFWSSCKRNVSVLYQDIFYELNRYYLEAKGEKEALANIRAYHAQYVI